jgi:trans-aconitate methyltransferase
VTIEAVRELEEGKAPPFPDDAVDCFGWAPYDLDEFARLLGIAIGAARGRTFLDAGCGIGTKCLLAAERGLAAHGIDRVPAYAERAVQLGVSAEVADVRGWSRYGEFAIVYVSHPLRPGAEEPFERWLHGQMAPGSVLMTLRGAVMPEGWDVILREQYWRRDHEPLRERGVYVKPGRSDRP